MGHAVKGCPGDLDSTGQARWRLVRADFGADWSDVYAATLERYVRYLGMADEALEALTLPTGKLALTTHGSQGQLVQHPTWKSYLEAQRGASEAAEALCLTPRARAKAGEQKPVTPATSKFGGRL